MRCVIKGLQCTMFIQYGIFTYFDKSSLALASVIMPVCPVKYVRTNEPSSTLNNFTVLSLEAVSILVSSSAYSQLFTASL